MINFSLDPPLWCFIIGFTLCFFLNQSPRWYWNRPSSDKTLHLKSIVNQFLYVAFYFPCFQWNLGTQRLIFMTKPLKSNITSTRYIYWLVCCQKYLRQFKDFITNLTKFFCTQIKVGFTVCNRWKCSLHK